MRTLSFTRRKPADAPVVLGCEAPVEVASVVLSPGSDVKADDTRASALAVSANAIDHPLQMPLQLAQSTAEPSSQSFQQVMQVPAEHAPSYPKARSSPMSRLRRMMRSQSDGGLEIALVTANGLALPEAHAPEAASQPTTGAMTSSETDTTLELDASQHETETAATSSCTDQTCPVDPAAAPIAHTDLPQVDQNDASPSADSPQDKYASVDVDTSAASAACDVFLNASIQLLHSQSDARQRIRQLWFTIQRLRWENQVSDTGVELLHTELLAIMKSFSMEKLDGARHLKAGFLTLVQAPDMARPATVAKALFGGASSARPLGQRMWCTLSEEYGKLEMVPARDESSPSPPFAGITASPLAGLSTKLKLPNSLSWLLTDALQSPAGVSEQARAIKLHGCQVRKVPTASTARPLPSNGTVADVEVRHQIQILVPNTCPMRDAPDPATATSRAGLTSQVSYSIYTFEVEESDGGEDESESWACALDRVCMFHLYLLERSIRDTKSLSQYCDVLARHLPLCISLTWLRNRIDRYDPQHQQQQQHGRDNSPQQQQMFQHQQQQRRSSKNLSMIQIIKDLERDQVLVDQTLIAAATGGSTCDSVGSEQGNISGVVKHMVLRVMEFVRRTEQRVKSERTAASVATTTSECENSRRVSRPSSAAASVLPSSSPPQSSPSPPGLPTSPTNRFAKYTEARALAFVERVLRGSSRTQSGGDIYDAISFFCQHSRVSICPVSHDVCPVQMHILSDDACDVFQVEVQVRMQFKIIEMTPMTAAPATAPSALLPPRARSISPSFESLADMPTVMKAVPASARETTASSDYFRGDTSNSASSLGVLEGPKEWAVLEGTLSRQFTLGKLSEPGTVTIAYLSPER